MGAVLEPVAFDHALFEAELDGLGHLLRSKSQLSEMGDVQPFFKARKHLSAFFGTYAPKIGIVNELGFEFSLFGDYRADLIVGNRKDGHFCVVEFEDGRPDSIFKTQPKRANPEWSPRFEHGFSQLVDWYFNLDDFKKTSGFERVFGRGHVSFTGLLVVGRNSGLDDAKRSRLRWRSEKVQVESRAVICVTFDDVYETFKERYSLYKTVALLEKPLTASPAAPNSHPPDEPKRNVVD